MPALLRARRVASYLHQYSVSLPVPRSYCLYAVSSLDSRLSTPLYPSHTHTHTHTYLSFCSSSPLHQQILSSRTNTFCRAPVHRQPQHFHIVIEDTSFFTHSYVELCFRVCDWVASSEHPTMDVRNPRGRVFSILNDNNSPSFVIRHTTQPSPPSPPPPPAKLQPAPEESRQERPSILRGAQYTKRQSSFSSAGSAGSPPLFRHDSSSSKSSSGSMDSSPSPITPVYNYSDAAFLPYDNLLRQDFLPSPTSITPFIEQQLMIAPLIPEHLSQFPAKTMGGGLPPIAPSQYPLPSVVPMDQQQTLTPAPSLQSVSNSTSTLSASTKPSPANASNGSTGKKNKYPCPYAASHNCSATFTTSGHAARHGKKHTGEKGVHCPLCNKAFTRKGQHEATRGVHTKVQPQEARQTSSLLEEAKRPSPRRRKRPSLCIQNRSRVI